MRRRDLLAVMGVGLAGCTGPNPATPTAFRTSPPTASPTGAPTPTESDRPTATTRDPEPLSVSGSWPQFGADAARAGVTSSAGVPDDAEPYWHLRRIRSGPAVLTDGRLFHYAKLGADPGGRPTITRTREPPAGTAHEVYGEPYLLARNASDGAIAWSVPLSGFVAGWPAVADGHVVVGLRGRLAAFEASGGRMLWSHDLGERNVGNPTTVGDAVVVPIQGSVDGRTGEVLEEPAVRIHALDDGSLRWTVRPPKRGTRVAVADGTVVVASYGWDGTGVVLALSLADGTEVWRVETAGDFFEGLVVADGTIYVSSSERYVRALSLTDGSERWRREFERRPSGFAADAESVFVGSGETLASLAPEDGSIEWTAEANDRGNSFVALAVGEGTVYAGTAGVEACLSAFDRSDGTEQWSHRFPNTVVEGDMVVSGLEAQPTVADGAVYAYAADGLYAFGPRE
jgi:outer membrane protein assembly factor BamB